jgi:hypothetical protein
MMKWGKAVAGEQKTKVAFEELSDRLNEEWLEEWGQEEKCAMDERGESLRIYDVTLKNGEFLTCC